ncbi:MAG: YqaJ viral recombinase family protein [Clostridiales bacterium]|nr:YqaJ viral recombinase family protein [Clostridiales bacterium]
MLNKIKCADHDEWIKERSKSIGGSDAGVILGFNPYKSAYSLWAEKTGAVTPEDISEKEAVRLGNDLEDYVAKRFEEATGKKVRKCNYLVRNSLYPFAHACPDRLVTGEDAGLEIKTTSNYGYIHQCENGEFPEVWYAQCMHYMAVFGAKKWYLAVLCLGKGFYWFEIKRDDNEISALMGAEQIFWEKVTHGTPPDINGMQDEISTLQKVYPQSTNLEIDLGGVSDHIMQYKAYDDQVKVFEELRNRERAFIEQYMGEAEKGHYGDYAISWKTSERQTFDRKAFEEKHGSIPADCFKTSTTRTFRFMERK